MDKTQIEIELIKCVQDFNYWVDHCLDDIEISTRLHHRLVSIHPSANGNGRWARLASNIFLKQAIGQVVYWPENELFIATKFRSDYILALQSADYLNYNPLITLHKIYLKPI